MDTDRRPVFPGFALALGLLWLLTGAVYKLFDGNVADLPQSVLEKSPFDGWNTFRYAIAAELAVVGLVIALPRLGWLFLAGTYGVFLAVLFDLYQQGAESCGCMGGTVKITPMQMMLIDGGLLVAILVSRPWRLPKGAGLGPLAALALVAAGVAAPLLKLKPIEVPAATKPVRPPISQDVTPGSGAGSAVKTPPDLKGATAPDTAPTNAEGAAADLVEDAGEVIGDAVESVAETVGDAVEGQSAPPEDTTGLPPFMELPFKRWIGQNVYELPFASILDMSGGFIDSNSHVVVYRQTCEVCKAHLADLADKLRADPNALGGRPLVLMRIIEEQDTPENNLCILLPEPSQKVSLPALDRGYLATTPLSFDVDEGMNITEVTDLSKGGH